MHFIDPAVSAAGLFVGLVVGLTGMGGGALMTPLLVLFFNVQPLAAVSSDLVASLFMKPVAGGVHWRRGTVNKSLVKWLVMGSIPTAFAGVFMLTSFGHGESTQSAVKFALGIALLLVAAGIVARPALTRFRSPDNKNSVRPFSVRPIPTLLVGVVGGLVVGMTSVGSGSLVIVLLLLLYPRIRLSDLVGTDLVQAIPLVASASLGHLLFGDFQFGLTSSILVGAIPGAYVGARLSSRAPDHWIRPALVVVLLASGLKLVGASNLVLGCTVPVMILLSVWHATATTRALASAAVQALGTGAGPQSDATGNAE
ncbi:MAG TPA: sulfite exporter TauE/SafE family protein [Polyangiaceae bacterium]|jgi:hypothetical protein|nr:sulfite exporter TauE/SafE family protein [Polyangiaceae bacterium]